MTVNEMNELNELIVADENWSSEDDDSVDRPILSYEEFYEYFDPPIIEMGGHIETPPIAKFKIGDGRIVNVYGYNSWESKVLAGFSPDCTEWCSLFEYDDDTYFTFANNWIDYYSGFYWDDELNAYVLRMNYPNYPERCWILDENNNEIEISMQNGEVYHE